MNKGVIGFLAGALLGAAAGFLAARRQYNKRLEEELDLMQATQKRRDELKKERSAEEKMEEEPKPSDFDAQEQKAYELLAKKYRFKHWDDMARTGVKDNGVDDLYSNEEDMHPTEEPADKPYIIRPEQFQEEMYPNNSPISYNKVTLYFDEDEGTLEEETALEDDDDNVLWDAIGKGVIEHMGEYEEGVVCVRNERLATDYWIQMKDTYDPNDPLGSLGSCR